ncbi:MAG TPA: VOC family protein [Longimicrobiaceae bacterium]|nr:VOC family protein [Longimicrobiaceae bacterium]
MPRPIHFEIPASDPERAIRFYQGLFGWTFTQWEGPQPYWLVSTGEGPGIDGGLMQRPIGPGAGTVNTVDVASLDASLAQAQAAGGEVVVPKMAIPGVGWLAYCKDPDGNVFGMMEADTGAGGS